MKQPLHRGPQQPPPPVIGPEMEDVGEEVEKGEEEEEGGGYIDHNDYFQMFEVFDALERTICDTEGDQREAVWCLQQLMRLPDHPLEAALGQAEIKNARSYSSSLRRTG